MQLFNIIFTGPGKVIIEVPCSFQPNMVTPGMQCSKKATPQEVARATLTALSRGAIQ